MTRSLPRRQGVDASVAEGVGQVYFDPSAPPTCLCDSPSRKLPRLSVASREIRKSWRLPLRWPANRRALHLARSTPLKAIYLTAGAAGMFCGSCMHDNALARAMRAAGDDVLLQPVYTPIRTDEVDIAAAELFYGGIQVYLLQLAPWTAKLPARLRHWLDHPRLVRWATRRAGGTDATRLGPLTLSMLRGTGGRQATEATRLIDWLADQSPDAIILSNLLIGGILPDLARRLPQTRRVVVLQGDDIFLSQLADAHRPAVVAAMSDLVQHVDRFVVHSQFYRDKMAAMLSIDPNRFDVHPLTIDTAPFENVTPLPRATDAFRIGYLARIAPEKGLLPLAEAFTRLTGNVELHAAGWLGDHNRGYLAEVERTLAAAGCRDRFHYHGSPTLAGKAEFLASLDVLSVPAPYEDPKGLFLLESMAAGVPVVQPDHGAFGELIRATGGGRLYPPGDAERLVGELESLRADGRLCGQLAADGRAAVMRSHTIGSGAAAMRRSVGTTTAGH